jgi:hypothetical protein
LKKANGIKLAREVEVVSLSSIKTDNEDRIHTTIQELDRVVGGGIAYGFEKALGGEGKMTGGAFEDDKMSASDEATLSKAFKNIKGSATAGEDYPEY